MSVGLSRFVAQAHNPGRLASCLAGRIQFLGDLLQEQNVDDLKPCRLGDSSVTGPCAYGSGRRVLILVVQSDIQRQQDKGRGIESHMRGDGSQEISGMLVQQAQEASEDRQRH